MVLYSSYYKDVLVLITQKLLTLVIKKIIGIISTKEMIIMELCQNPNILKTFLLLKLVFKIFCTLLPLVVMFYCINDIFKSMIAKKPEDELKSVITSSIKRFISALIVFLLPNIFTFIFTDLVDTNSNMSQCFTNSTLEKINYYKEAQEQKLKDDKEAERHKIDQSMKDRIEQEKKQNEIIQAEKEQNQSSSTTISGSSQTIGNSKNPNMNLKTYTGSKSIKYWELVPSNISNKPALIVFLHGSGECGNPNGQLNTGMTKFMNNGSFNNYNAIAIAPNTTACSWSSDSTITKELIDYVINEYNIDKNHIIITGHSLGGNGTFHMVSKYPNFFSAAVPVSGCPYDSVDKYLNIPIKSYVGASESNYYNCNKNVINSINSKGGNAELISVEKPNNTHGTVINIYGNSSLINWMLKQ